jgi:hypothetical protein
MTLDPDRRRPAPPHPGFDQRQIDVDIDVCRWCGAHVPASERERTKHEEWDGRIVARFLTLFERLELQPGASTPAAGGPPAGTTRPPAPTTTPATSPAGEGGPGGRQDAGGGVEGTGDATQPAPTGPTDPEQADLLAYEQTLADQGEP